MPRIITASPESSTGVRGAGRTTLTFARWGNYTSSVFMKWEEALIHAFDIHH